MKCIRLDEEVGAEQENLSTVETSMNSWISFCCCSTLSPSKHFAHEAAPGAEVLVCDAARQLNMDRLLLLLLLRGALGMIIKCFKALLQLLDYSVCGCRRLERTHEKTHFIQCSHRFDVRDDLRASFHVLLHL